MLPSSAIKASVKKGQTSTSVVPPTAISIQLDNGTNIDTSVITDFTKLSGMSKNARQDALAKLQALQEQMNSMMNALKQ